MFTSNNIHMKTVRLKKIALPVHVQACYKFHSNSNEMFEDALCTLGNTGNWDKNKGIRILILILT